MWVKCTNDEVTARKTEAKRRHAGFAALLGAVIWLIAGFLREKGWRRSHSSPFVPWDEVGIRLAVFLPLGIIVGLFVNRSSSFKPKRSMICPQCETTKREDAEVVCSCGGRFEYLDCMKWVGQ
jgi:hypothetical protein